MSDTSLNRYLGQGDDAAEAAYTPVPVTGTTPEQAVLYVNDQDPANPRIDWWDGANFVSTQGAGGGTVTNTGTLTSGKAIIGNGGVDVTVSALTAQFVGSSSGTEAAASMTTNRLLGRTTAASGAVEEITPGASLKFASGALNGRIVQVVNTTTGAVATGTTQIPVDDTIPQNTEGDQYMSLAITPTNASNILRIQVLINLASDAALLYQVAALFQDTTANALDASLVFTANTSQIAPVSIDHWMTAGTTSATTFKVRAGRNGSATTTVNGAGAARIFGGVLESSITITEITV